MQMPRICMALVLFVATTSSAADDATTKKDPPAQEAPPPKKQVCNDGIYRPKDTNKYAKFGSADTYAYVKPECPVEF